MNWLTEQLKKEVRSVFEPRYQRKLTNDEVMVIASNLTNFIENYARFRLRRKHENEIER